jgi:site-specific DNA-methyltransferase (adenine-specific)
MIIKADSRHIPLDDDSVNCIITSPPYWSLRKYDIPDVDFGDWRGQLGLEPTIDLYLKHLMQIMDECKRVLRDDGTMWVNLGDSYGGSNSGGIEDNKAAKFGTGATSLQEHRPSKGMMAKSLCLIPYRFAIAMIDRGWICRNLINWWKPNCMPSSAKDRFTVDFEPIFFFVKSRKYWFEQQYEPFHPNTDVWYRKELREGKEYNCKKPYKGNTPYATTKAQNPQESKARILESMKNSHGRNRRCVWTIPTQPYPESHFATFPEALVEPMIRAGCPKGGTVLDPFCGSGTVMRVAEKLGRKGIGIDLGYTNLAEKKCKKNQIELF